MPKSRFIVVGLLCLCLCLVAWLAWHLNSGCDLERLPEVHHGLAGLAGPASSFTVAAFSPNGRWLAAAGLDGSVRLWSTETWKEICTVHGPAKKVTGLAFSPDEDFLASTGNDQQIHVWDVPSGKELQTLSGQNCIAFDPSGKRLSAEGGDRRLKTWEVGTWVERSSWEGQTLRTTSIAYSPNGTRLAACGWDETGKNSKEWTLRVWDAGTGKLLYRSTSGSITTGPGSTLSSGNLIAFTRDGKRLFAANEEEDRIKVLDAAGGEELITLHGHRQAVTCLALRPGGGRALATSSLDGSVRVWDATPLPDVLPQSISPNMHGTSKGYFSTAFVLRAGNETPCPT